MNKILNNSFGNLNNELSISYCGVHVGVLNLRWLGIIVGNLKPTLLMISRYLDVGTYVDSKR